MSPPRGLRRSVRVVALVCAALCVALPSVLAGTSGAQVADTTRPVFHRAEVHIGFVPARAPETFVDRNRQV